MGEIAFLDRRAGNPRPDFIRYHKLAGLETEIEIPGPARDDNEE
jgi:hypothetical protein